MSAPIVVVGAGQAAASFISRHVALGNQTPVVLLGEESHPPYQRPPLSKKYLLGELEQERLLIRPADWYNEHGIDTRYDTRAASIDRKGKTVTTTAGETMSYSKLVICTGSSARQLPAALGGDLPGVFTLRSIQDIGQMQPQFTRGKKLLILGGGYIGLEAAAVARQLGMTVTLLEMAPRILQRVAAERTSDYFRNLHNGHGVNIRESTKLKTLLETDGRVSGGELESGEVIDADLVLVGIGGQANTSLAETAGLDCDNGICVDQQCRSSDPDIFAAGDCCSFIRNGVRIRLESVQNASDQGDLVARVINGEDKSYDATPWFWSDQYDCRLQIAGLNQGHDHTAVRHGENSESLSVWYYHGDQLLAVDAMNDAKSYAFGRKLIEAGKSPSPEVISDPATDLKALLKA